MRALGDAAKRLPSNQALAHSLVRKCLATLGSIRTVHRFSPPIHPRSPPTLPFPHAHYTDSIASTHMLCPLCSTNIYPSTAITMPDACKEPRKKNCGLKHI